MTFTQLKNLLNNNQITYEQILAKTNRDLDKYNQLFNFEISRLSTSGKVDENAPLYGLMLGVKDSYSIEDQNLSLSSETLINNYYAPFNATAISNLTAAGATLISRLALDEFCLAGTGTHSATGIVHNPWDPTRISGGSSSGSAAAVSSGALTVALGTDTGDSIRKPAALNGIVGYKPSYGLISRYGISEYCASLDTAGTLGRSVDDVGIVAHYMMGKDEKDFSQSNQEVSLLGLKPKLTDKRIAIIQEVYDDISDLEIKNQFNQTINTLKNAGAIVEFVNLDKKILNNLLTTYYIIAFSESTSSIARIDAVNYGKRFLDSSYEGLIVNSRTQHMSEYIKMRFMLGSYFLNTSNIETVFNNAKRFRSLLKDRMNHILNNYDAFIAPTTNNIAPKISDVQEDISFKGSQWLCDDSLLIANFLGLPSISIPIGFKSGMPIGVCFTAPQYEDRQLLEITKGYEELTGLKGLKAGDSHE